jgi:hypothetical protein
MLPVGTSVTVSDPIHAYRGRHGQVECVKTLAGLVVYSVTVGGITFRLRREHLKLAA